MEIVGSEETFQTFIFSVNARSGPQGRSQRTNGVDDK